MSTYFLLFESYQSDLVICRFHRLTVVFCWWECGLLHTPLSLIWFNCAHIHCLVHQALGKIIEYDFNSMKYFCFIYILMSDCTLPECHSVAICNQGWNVNYWQQGPTFIFIPPAFTFDIALNIIELEVFIFGVDMCVLNSLFLAKIDSFQSLKCLKSICFMLISVITSYKTHNVLIPFPLILK